MNVSDGISSSVRGFFSAKHHLSFKVQTPALKTENRRKDEDFNLLQEYLCKAYPNIVIPPLTNSKA